MDGIYLVGSSGLTFPGDCETYLVKTGKTTAVLIDAGLDPTARRIIRNLVGLDTRVTHLILTHAHIDHIGGAHAIQERYGCTVVAHELDREPIEHYDPVRTAANVYGIRYAPVKVDECIKEDTTLQLGDREFHIHHIPGHTPGSIAVSVVVDGRKVLFGQDVHGPFHRNWGSDTGLWRESVRKLIALDADLLCEGHFGVYEPREKVREYLERFLTGMA